MAKQPATTKAATKTSRKKRAVRIGIYGVAKVLKMIHEKGDPVAFKKAMKDHDKTVTISAKTYRAIKDFVGSRDELKGFSTAKQMDVCDPEFEICWGKATHPDFTKA
ncbi:hypothetical protein SAMN05519104_3655 [Rhizobiales bacterium GAS188]|nr:hypothetical protein SAMN05519104_3655 [Rhizobiales bacterium GAS188]